MRYLHDVERAHGLPVGVRQSGRTTGRGERGSRALRDVVYPDFGLVVELDGRAGHTEDGRLRDLRRDNVSTLRGERSLRYGWFDVVDDACLVARQVAHALHGGGWTGVLQPCAHCRNVPDEMIV